MKDNKLQQNEELKGFVSNDDFADEEVREELVSQMKSAYLAFGTVGMVFMAYQIIGAL